MRRAGSRGTSLIETMAAVAVFGLVIVSLAGLMHDVARESARSVQVSGVRAARWEAVRRLRADVARASSASAPTSSELALVVGGAGVRWRMEEGSLVREAEASPAVAPSPLEARFTVDGRLVGYELADEAGTIAGRALVGSAP